MSGRGRAIAAWWRSRVVAGCVFAVLLPLACRDGTPREPLRFVDPLRGALPEIASATISVTYIPGFVIRDPDAAPVASDGLEGLELAFGASGHVLWCESGDVAMRHRVARIAPTRVEELARLVRDTIAERSDAPPLAADAGHEQLCVRFEGTESIALLQGVFSMRDEHWGGRLAVSYIDDPSIEVARQRDRERYPQEVEWLTAWHAVKDRIRAEIPEDGELVDRVKLATPGLR